MARPEPKLVTFEIDGREVTAPEGAMLVDGAKYGDVEIPVFCYEPKLGAPVGACRMCLVEIEGIPKLQTACSTPVKDGMVVDHDLRPRQARAGGGRRVPARQPPARLPGLRQGRRVPAAGHLVRLGRRAARASSSRSATSRSRSSCRRWSRSTASAASSATAACASRRRSPRTTSWSSSSAATTPSSARTTAHPYVAPFSGNIIELCPVGALTSTAYRFRARPWDIEDAGSICTLCPSQCNVEFTVRDDTKVLRVHGARQRGRRRRLAVRQGPLRLPGDPLARADHRADGARRRRAARGLVGARARRGGRRRSRRPAQQTAALVGGETTNEEGFLLQLLMRDVLGSPHIDSRPAACSTPTRRASSRGPT